MAEDMENKEALQQGQGEQVELQLQRQQTIINDMDLPGFRFHPTEEELVGYYLRRMVQGRQNSVELIASLDLYQYDPWELPAMAFMGEKEWFFFCPRDKKYPNGARPNRVTASGYWKATGTDRAVRCTGDFRCIGLKKTLVFYTGRAPRGSKTDWIMNEYRMPKLLDRSNSFILGSSSAAVCTNTIITQSGYENVITKNDVALCRIYRKSSAAAPTAGDYLQQSAQTEDVATRPSCSNDQQLVTISTLEKRLQASAQKYIRSCSQRLVLDTPTAQILQDSKPSAPPDPSFVSSSSSSYHHQVLGPRTATTNSSLRSSHALMARLVEETSCYDSHSSNQLEERSRELQNALRVVGRLPGTQLLPVPEHLAMAKMEEDMESSPTQATVNSITDEGSLIETKGSCIDIFQHRHHVQHQDAGPPLDILRSTAAAVHPAAEMNDVRVLQGCCTVTQPQQAAAAGIADDIQSNMLEMQSLIQSQINNREPRCHDGNDNTGAYSRLLLPAAHYWRHVVHSSSNSGSSQEPSLSAPLGPDTISSFAFPL